LFALIDGMCGDFGREGRVAEERGSVDHLNFGSEWEVSEGG
jgi:hypothetical protein